jgi:hypothetical protein
VASTELGRLRTSKAFILGIFGQTALVTTASLVPMAISNLAICGLCAGYVSSAIGVNAPPIAAVSQSSSGWISPTGFGALNVYQSLVFLPAPNGIARLITA